MRAATVPPNTIFPIHPRKFAPRRHTARPRSPSQNGAKPNITEYRVTKVLIAITIVALAAGAGDALAQGKGKGGGNPPTWSGSNPPGFNSPGNRTGWGGTSHPPGWDKAQTSPGWTRGTGGTVPPGLRGK